MWNPAVNGYELLNHTVWLLFLNVILRKYFVVLFSLHTHSVWETTVMHQQVSGWTVNFGPNFLDQSLLRNTPPPFGKTSDLGWPKFTPEYPPFRKTSDLGWPKFALEYPPWVAMYYGSYYMMTSGGFLCILGKLICIVGNFNIFPHLLLRHTQAHKEGVTYWYVSFLLVLVALF